MIRNYCWGCKEETNQLPTNTSGEISVCQVCGTKNWTEDYPIGDSEIPQNPLIAARQRYQVEKHAYYQK